MQNGDSFRVSPLVERLLPDATPEERSIAQANLDHFVSVLYRICDRLEREAESSKSDRAEEDAKFDTSLKEI
jgi:hypothetical protein